MATHISAEKRNRQNIKRREHNRHFKTTMRTAIRKLRVLMTEKKSAEAATLLKDTVSTIFSTASKGVIKKTTAGRYVSRLSRQVSALSKAPATPAAAPAKAKKTATKAAGTKKPAAKKTASRKK